MTVPPMGGTVLESVSRWSDMTSLSSSMLNAEEKKVLLCRGGEVLRDVPPSPSSRCFPAHPFPANCRVIISVCGRTSCLQALTRASRAATLPACHRSQECATGSPCGPGSPESCPQEKLKPSQYSPPFPLLSFSLQDNEIKSYHSAGSVSV